jgi:tetratricopeptide (TPR) repeat protein
MGALLANLGEHQKAINSYNIALNINPHLHKAWYNTACSYVLIGNIDQAIYNLEQAINLNPEECRKSATNDSVFDNIRNDARFQALLQE